jgi:nicotinate-nucleotide pyrophosphorylase (carboxylating)
MPVRDDLHPPYQEVRRAVEVALGEDIGPLGDLSGSLVDRQAKARAEFVARQPGVVAGMRCTEVTCRLVDSELELEVLIDDGGRVEAGLPIARLSGSLQSVLLVERTALNFLCHLSGIATLTRRFVDAATSANPHVRILDTRKTTPGLRALEKAAVRAGGGANHRASLSDAVLIKDNHLSALSIADAVATASVRWPGRMVEVECDTLEQVVEAAAAGATAVLCDNMNPDEVAAAVRLARETQRSASPLLVEASGGVTLENVARLAAAGPDLISVGALTHSAAILDIGLDIKR